MTVNADHRGTASTVSFRGEYLVVTLFLVVFVVLAIGFSLGPILEGADEYPHYQFIRAIIQARGLPDVYSQPLGGQYHQAPLYYTLAAPLVIVANDADFTQISSRGNPFFGYAFTALGNDNKNVLLHTVAESFPYRRSGTALAVHLVRLLSVALGTGTVVASYAIFRLLWPGRPDRRLAALGLVAFWPQFIFLSGTINNDNLLIFLSTLSLWLTLRQVRDGPSWRGATMLGVALGAALLAKASALVLAIPVGLAVLLDLRRAWRRAALTLTLTLLVGGWWYVRNMILYGDPIGLGNLLTRWGMTMQPTQGLTWVRIASIHDTLWARFGYEVVRVSTLIYTLLDWLAILALIGATIQMGRVAFDVITRRSPHLDNRREILIAAVFALTWVAGLIYLVATAYSGNRGRYLFPAIAIWGALFAFGLDIWTLPRLRLSVALSGVALMSTVAAICLFGYFLPAYRPLPLPAQIEHPLTLRFETAAELIGVRSEVVHARPGQTIRISLYWRAIQPTDTGLTAYLHSVGSNIVFRDSLPATGNLLSTDWLPGQTWAEEYVVVIPQDAEQQVAYPLVAGLYETQTLRGLTATDAAGNEVTPFVGWIAINGPAQPFDPDYRFGDVIGLAEPQITRRGEQLEVCLRWLSLAPTSTDYLVFVHVLNDDGQLVTQSDSPPKGGRYPTDVWVSGEAVDDCISLNVGNLPAVGWHVALGLYQLPGGERLPVQNRQGQTLPDSTVSITLGG